MAGESDKHHAALVPNSRTVDAFTTGTVFALQRSFFSLFSSRARIVVISYNFIVEFFLKIFFQLLLFLLLWSSAKIVCPPHSRRRSWWRRSFNLNVIIDPDASPWLVRTRDTRRSTSCPRAADRWRRPNTDGFSSRKGIHYIVARLGFCLWRGRGWCVIVQMSQILSVELLLSDVLTIF